MPLALQPGHDENGRLIDETTIEFMLATVDNLISEINLVA
jgi:hypothetical protein